MANGDGLDAGAGLDPEAVEKADFGTVRRGYQPEPVRSRLRAVGAEIRRLNALVASLQERIAEFEATPVEKLDTARAVEALGDEAARVLQAARDAGQERLERAEAESDELDAKAKVVAAAIVEQGREQGRDLVVEARNVRERILSDLAYKRHAHRVEVEQLRVIRDRLLEAVSICREGLDGWIAELVRAGPQAAAAAERAGLRIAAEPESTVGEMEAEIHAARLAGLPLDVGSGQAASDDEAAAAGTDSGPQEAGDHSADADADGAEPADLEALEELEELDELDETSGYVEIVGYEDDPPEPSGSAAVGLYDVEAESAFKFDAGPGPVHGQAPVLEADLAPVADDAPERALQAAAASDADAIFARLRSITSMPASEPPPEREELRPAAASAEEAPAGEGPGAEAPAGTAAVASEPDDLMSAARAVASEPDDLMSAARAVASEPDDLMSAARAVASEPDDLMSAARAVAVGGIARRLKRLVVDEQGELLDAMRRSGSRALRGAAGTDAGAYTRAALAPLQDFASDIDVSIDDIDLKAAGAAIVSVLVEPVRARLGELIDEIDDSDELANAVRSIYRESRSRRAEAAAEAAFAAGWPEAVS